MLVLAGAASLCCSLQCAQAQWNETDTHVCQLPCQCPAEGGRCTLGASCERQNFTCKPGYARFSDGQPKCYKAGCQEASLHVGGPAGSCTFGYALLPIAHGSSPPCSKSSGRQASTCNSERFCPKTGLYLSFARVCSIASLPACSHSTPGSSLPRDLPAPAMAQLFLSHVFAAPAYVLFHCLHQDEERGGDRVL